MGIKVDIKRKLGEFSLDIHFQTESKRIGILGASGCGKSMTLKSIAGIEIPDSGMIQIDDKVLFDSANKVNLKPQKRNVGYLFQNYALFPTMTVAKNIAAGLKGSKEENQKKVQEMIEDLGIPVFVDYSSYESHPLGRTEWIKLYGALLNKEEEADTFFDQQAQVIEELKGFENTEKTVAYFYVSTDGSIVVRKSDDYIPSMIEIAGGRYAFKDLKNPDSNAPSVKLTMEEFYATAVDADYLIYNGTIDGQVNSISELEAKNELFSEFKAVKDGNVWYTGKNLYQATDTVGELIKDMHLMLTGGDASQMTFLEKME